MIVNKNESRRDETILMDLVPKSCKSILLFGFPKIHKLVSSVKSVHIEIYGKDNLQRETKKVFETMNSSPEKDSPYLLASYFTTGNELGFSFSFLLLVKTWINFARRIQFIGYGQAF